MTQLRGVRYEWLDTERFGDQLEIGFIAQEVNEVLPEVVRKGGDYWSLNTRNIVAVVVEAIKELWTSLQTTQADVDELQTELEQLQQEVEALQAGQSSTTAPAATAYEPPVNEGAGSDPEEPEGSGGTPDEPLEQSTSTSDVTPPQSPNSTATTTTDSETDLTVSSSATTTTPAATVKSQVVVEQRRHV